MNQADAKIATVRGGLCYFAEVSVDVDLVGSDPSVVFACSGTGFQGQGHLEDVPALGYDDWKAGAREGALFALRVMGLSHGHVTIRRIAGLTSDTSPIIVAACAARAVWNALQRDPPVDAVARLDALMVASFGHPLTEVPDLVQSAEQNRTEPDKEPTSSGSSPSLSSRGARPVEVLVTEPHVNRRVSRG